MSSCHSRWTITVIRYSTELDSLQDNTVPLRHWPKHSQLIRKPIAIHKVRI